MVRILLVGAGGFLGSVTRYLVGLALYSYIESPGFPYATLVINVIGCFAIGLFNGVAESRDIFSPEARLFTVVGLFGGFTTYSAFGYETLALARNATLASAAANIVLHIVLGLGAVWLGYWVSQVASARG